MAPRHRAPGRAGLALLIAALSAAAALRIFGFFPYAHLFLARIVLLIPGLALLAGGLAGWGLLARAAAGVREPARFSSAWALGALSTATLFGAAAPLWVPGRGPAAAWLGLGLLGLGRFRNRLRGEGWVPGLGWLNAWLVAFAIPPLLLALAPPISLDSLVYHLAIPKQFQLAGRAFEMPWNVHSYFPLHAEVLYGFALELGGGVLAQLLHLLAAGLAAAAVGRLGDRLFGRPAGSWAALLLLTLPVLNLVAGWAWSDWFVLLYLTLALERLPAARRGSLRDFGLLAAFLGGAAAVKYYALPVLALLPVALRRRSARWVAAGGLAALVPLLPWYGRNLLLTGNPVFPAFSGDPRARILAAYRGEVPWWQRLSDLLGRADLVDESAGILLFASLPLLFLVPRDRQGMRPILGLVAVSYLAVGLLLNPTVRALSPLFLAVSLVLGGAIAGARWGRWWRAAGSGGLCGALLIHLAQVAWVVHRYEPLPAALAFQPADSYLAAGQSYVPAFRWLEEKSAPEEGVLVVGESRIFHLDRPAIAGSFADPPPFTAFLEAGCDPGCLAGRLARRGVRWVFLNEEQYRVVARAPTVHTDELAFFASPPEDAMLRALLARFGRETFRLGPTRLFRLLPPDGGG